jgi:hypothetical protein
MRSPGCDRSPAGSRLSIPNWLVGLTRPARRGCRSRPRWVLDDVAEEQRRAAVAKDAALDEFRALEDAGLAARPGESPSGTSASGRKMVAERLLAHAVAAARPWRRRIERVPHRAALAAMIRSRAFRRRVLRLPRRSHPLALRPDQASPPLRQAPPHRDRRPFPSLIRSI